MVALGTKDSFEELQELVRHIYGKSNLRWFDLGDMATNVSRFTMRAIKAVRREQVDRVEKNLAIALSWFTSSANRLDMTVSDVTWQRFQYECATCRYCPCSCSGYLQEATHSEVRVRPESIDDFQRMFATIYHPASRTLEHAAIHLVEEMGEYQEAILMYRTRHRDLDLEQIAVEMADYFSCALGVYSSIAHQYGKRGEAAQALAELFDHNCHACGKAPCMCSFDKVMNYNLDDKW